MSRLIECYEQRSLWDQVAAAGTTALTGLVRLIGWVCIAFGGASIFSSTGFRDADGNGGLRGLVGFRGDPEAKPN